jgi:hypothetical protein
MAKERPSRTDGLLKIQTGALLKWWDLTNRFCDLLQVDHVGDETRQQLVQLQKSGTHTTGIPVADLSKRKLIERKKLYYFSVEKGDDFTSRDKKHETDITSEMMQT